MIALPSRVPSYTTNFTTPEVATMPKLGQWSWMLWGQWRSSWLVLRGGVK